jgi:hypothetical protein
MENLHDQVYKMWKDAAERNPAKESVQFQKLAISSMPQIKKLDPLMDFIPEHVEKKFLKKPTPEEIARRIWNNSRNRRKML